MYTINYHNLIQEFTFRTSTSSGPGGQHANRSQTRIEAIFNISDSKILTKEQKIQLKSKLKSKLTEENELIISIQDTRSQFRNKELAIERMFKLIAEALKKKKKRISTWPSRASIENRLQNKKHVSQKKQLRGKPKDV